MSVTATDAKRKAPRKKRNLWRILLWVFLAVLIIAAIMTSLAWVNRYSLLEKAAEDLLLEQGIQAELSIQSVSKTRAVLKTIRFSDGNSEFFSADEVIADYAWREALKGRVEKLQLIKPEARLTLDENGKIIDGWLPPTSEDGAGNTALPPQGIIITEGLFTIGSPYGNAEAQLNASIFAPDKFIAEIDIAPTTFSYRDWRVEGGGKLEVKLDGADPHIDVDVNLAALEHPAIDATHLKIAGAFTPHVTEDVKRLDGQMDFGFERLVTAQATIGAGDVTWDGRIEQNSARAQPLALDGTWSADVTRAILPDPARRNSLAKTLSLSDTLLKAPLAQNFSADLTRNITRLLEASDMTAKGRIALNEAGLEVSLLSPAKITSARTTLNLRQTDWAPVYRFTRAEQKLRLAFHAGLTQPAGLKFQEAEMVARSTNGFTLDGVEKFSANISTTETWRSKGPDGQAARLAPFEAQTLYSAPGNNGNAARNMVLAGGVDYDGSVPGGYAVGLKTAGRMTMDLRGNVMSVKFKPGNDAPITMSRFETPTEWRGEDISAALLSEKPIYRRRGNVSSMDAELANVSLIAIDSTNTRHLGMVFEGMTVSGELKGERQSWDVLGRTLKITSEDMPGPGTVITAPQSRIQIERTSAEVPMQFFMAAPTANVKTQLVTATKIKVEAAGTPDAYTLNYSPGTSNEGRVKFIGDAIPRLPMTGAVNYGDGAFEGTARTTLPLTEDTPINITYRFKDGAGTANVDIPELRFTPKGLQPQYLVSALKGKLAEVEGLVEANIKLGFAAGQPLQSSGTAKIIDMNFGTLPGPLTNVNTELTFSNMFPLQSEGRQKLTVAKFDPGFPLENGVIEFELIPDGVKVYSARWPLGDGFFSLDPFDWLYSNAVNRVVMRIENVSIGEFLKDVGDGALTATGNMEGTLPIVLSGIDVKVENGELFVKEGGRIQYKSKQLNAISEFDGTDEKAVKAMRQGNYRDAAFEALKDFRYEELRVKIDGPLDGAMGVFLKFDGKNQDVLGGQPFRFDIALEGELLNILRSFNTNAQIKSELLRRGLTKEEEIPDLEQ
ncbi:MAG: YdbH domain-containing protein [Hellea sp.]